MTLTNCHSILPKIDNIRATLAAHCAQQPDLFACTETWLNGNIGDNLINSAGYNTFPCDRLGRSGGCSAVFVKQTLRAALLSSPCVKPDNIDCVWIKVPSKQLYCACVYIPPNLNSTLHLDITNYIISTFDYLNTNHLDSIIICGDFNDYDTSKLCTALDVFDIVTVPTRGDAILDKILVTKNIVNFSTELGPPIASDYKNSMSDHCCVLSKIILPGAAGGNTIGHNVVYDLRKRFVSNFVSKQHLNNI